MNDGLDLKDLDGIGDPFAGEAAGPARPMTAEALPAPVRDSPTRSRVHAARWAALVAAVAIDALWTVIHEHRPDLEIAPALEIACGLLVPLSAAALALAAVVRSGPRGLGLPTTKLLPLLVAVCLLFVAGTQITAPSSPPDPLFWAHAGRCIKATMGFTVVPLVLGLWAFRRSFAAAAAWRTAAIGMAAGALAATVMSVACSLTSAPHVLLGHGLMILVAGLVGALVAPFVARA
jgi:hypothetical protein